MMPDNNNLPESKKHSSFLGLKVTEKSGGQRLESFVRAQYPHLSRRGLRHLLEQRLIKVDGQWQPKGYRLQPGQEVILLADLASLLEQPIIPQPELELDIIELTPELVVINKPVGRHSHPLLPGEQGTVANALVARFSECITASVASREGGLIHRLDLYTSGVLLAARHRTAYLHFRELFTGGHVQKHYLALVVGVINESGSILTGIRPMPNDPARVKVVELDEIDHDSPTAHTEFYPIEQLGTFTLVRLIATTGRRHQIRVHMAHIGHPLVGDETYGGPTVAGVQGAFLHAEQIKIHSEGYSFSAPLPSQRQEFLERLRGKKKE